jgi:hypothetical protein
MMGSRDIPKLQLAESPKHSTDTEAEASVSTSVVSTSNSAESEVWSQNSSLAILWYGDNPANPIRYHIQNEFSLFLSNNLHCTNSRLDKMTPSLASIRPRRNQGGRSRRVHFNRQVITLHRWKSTR